MTDGIDIQESVSNFEKVLTELVSSIGKFQPSSEMADKLIGANDALLSSISTLKLHQEYGQKIQSLKSESDNLDKQLNSLLIGLSDCRRELIALPSSSEPQSPQKDGSEGGNNNGSNSTTTKNVTADELLKYATKITKFTHAPPRYNPQMPEHANFPWPTEDELRRGVLAQISNTMIEEPQTGGKENSTAQRRRGSMVSYGEPMHITTSGGGLEQDQPGPGQVSPGGQTQQNQQTTQKVLDLDLFDPDEEDD